MLATKAALASGAITRCCCDGRRCFGVRPIVLSLALPTICNSTTFSSKDAASIWRGQPGPIASRAISLASAARRSPARGRFDCTARQDGFEAFHDKLPSRSRRRDAVSSASAIRLSLHPRRPPTRPLQRSELRQQMRGALALRYVEPARSSSLSLTTYFLTATSGLATNIPSRNRQGIDQTIPSNSRRTLVVGRTRLRRL